MDGAIGHVVSDCAYLQQPLQECGGTRDEADMTMREATPSAGAVRRARPRPALRDVTRLPVPPVSPDGPGAPDEISPASAARGSQRTSSGAREARRTSLITSCPSARRLATSAVPMSPDEPVTATFTVPG